VTFHHPSIWFLLLFFVLPLLWWRRRNPRRRSAIAFSSIEPVERIATTWAVRFRWIVPALRFAALALLIVALARPQKGDEQSRINTRGLAIQLIVDRSGSMRAMDFKLGGKPVDRLSVVKRVVESFVMGGGALAGRPNDVIGLIAFASFADSLCPITADHTHLIDGVKQMRIASEREESATAIGDAIALGVERLRSLESAHHISVQSPDAQIKGKVIILLTDGENNSGDIDPITAAQMAAAFNIKIYTIGAGTRDGIAEVPDTDIFGQRMRIPVSIDEESLTKIAEQTGGRYFRATDTDSLQQIYAQIDELEKTTIQERRYITFKEASIHPIAIGGLTIPPLVMMALTLLGLEVVLTTTRFRTLP
jgi:Ca-activated chloride channel family protein